VRDLLDRVGPSIAAGSVNLISVEAIRERSGPRWERKREQVEQFVERAFGRTSSPGACIVALNDAEFVTVQPDLSRWAALNLSANVLKEALQFFLGSVSREDIRLLQVTSFIGGQLGVEPVDPGRFIDGPTEGDGDDRGPPAEPDAPVAGSGAAPPTAELHGRPRRRAMKLVVALDGDLEAVSGADPIWNVRAKVVTSFVVDQGAAGPACPDGPPAEMRWDEISTTAAGDLALRNLVFAVSRIRAGRAAGLPIAMHAPLPLRAVSYSTTRYRLLHALRAVDEDVRKFLILELDELSEGLPQSRLSELVAMLAPHCRAVLARAPSETTSLQPWRRCGLSGVSLDCGHLEPADPGLQARLDAFARRARAVGPACLAYALPSRSVMLGAWAAGFTHLSGRPVLDRVHTLAAMRLDPRSFYGAG
jgi:hypothetical protein